MKKILSIIIKFLIIAIILFVFAIKLIDWWFNLPSNCNAPEKPSNVPEQAVWHGFSDAGYWIDLVEIKEDKYRFRIYLGWNGDLEMDADFKFRDKKIDLTTINWKDFIAGYWHSSTDSLVLLNFIVYDIEGKRELYQLQSIYPAYGGSDWDIIREKYNID